MSEELRVEPTAKWIRGFHRGRVVVDSRRARLVWEHRYYPVWYFPTDDVHAQFAPNGTTFESSGRGIGRRGDLRVDGDVLADAAWVHPESAALEGLVRVEWDALDNWFEEDVEVLVHPRSPEVRVDALASSRHVRVLAGDDIVAESHRPTVLFETGLPARFYLPMTDVRADLLRPTDTATACPYKGWARYWSLQLEDRVIDDAVWSYPTPLPESAAIAGLVSFYPDKFTIEVDGTAV